MTVLSNIITPSNVLTTTNTATVTNKTLTSPTVTGMTVSDGTASGVTYLNGSKVLTSGSALVFDGTNLGVGTTPTVFGAGYSTLTVQGSTTGFVQASNGTIITEVGTFGGIGYTGTRSNHSYGFVVSGSEQMRLTSTGLGIGTSSPWTKLSVYGSGSQRIAVTSPTGGATVAALDLSPSLTAGEAASYDPQARIYAVDDNYSANIIFANKATGATANSLQTRMTLNTAGNLGLGVTPSAWASIKAIEMGELGSAFAGGGNNVLMFYNAYFNSGFKYARTGTASYYQQTAGTHVWTTAASGTAGNAISFTQAMTLDASGNLGVGTTSPSAKLHIFSANSVSSRVETSGAGSAASQFKSPSGSTFLGQDATGGYLLTDYAAPILFYTNNTERARINAVGAFKASNTGTYAASTNSVNEFNTNANDTTLLVRNTATTGNVYGISVALSGQSPNNTTSDFLYCSDSTAQRASIRSNGGLYNYQANNSNLSDRREKTNFSPAKSYLDVICAIPVQTFNYIDQNMEDDGGLTLGVVAQDVQAVAPELVMESNWGTEEEPKMRLSIYQTDLQYALMKALQELKAEFDAYKASHP